MAKFATEGADVITLDDEPRTPGYRRYAHLSDGCDDVPERHPTGIIIGLYPRDRLDVGFVAQAAFARSDFAEIGEFQPRKR